MIALAAAPALAQSPTDLFISEYIEGTSNNKAIEIYNGTGAAIALSGVYDIQVYFNGSTSSGLTIALLGTVAPGDVFVLGHAAADPAILAQADQTNGSPWFNGNDAVVLRKSGVIIDSIGQIGVNPGTEWGTGLVSTADNTLRRKATVCAGDADAFNTFDPSVEWDGFATNTYDGLGAHVANCDTTTEDTAPAVVSTDPANGATGVLPSSNITLSFSEPVSLTTSATSVVCNSSTQAVTTSGGPVTFTLDPVSDLPAGGSCTVTVLASEVTDQDTNDPPDNMAENYVFSFAVGTDPCQEAYTPIFQIQGSGLSAAITGPVTTQGVVVGDYEGPSPALRGFYLQDPAGDGDPATSDGIFVFNANDNEVNLGDLVRVSGNAGEFQDQTQISLSATSNPITCGAGSVTPVDITLPVPDASYLERFEGMLVRMPQALYVTEHFQLGRFGQTVVTANPDRLRHPTHVATPGAAAQAVAASNDLNRIIVDDELNNQNPDPVKIARNGQPLSASNTLRGGDSVTGLVGVLTYTWAGNAASGNAYRVRPFNALSGTALFVAGNPRPATPAPVGGTVKVASFNVLNYFNTFGQDACTNGVGGSAADCRGADNATEFARQVDKTVAALAGLDADVVGLVELENDGYGPDSAIQDLVNRLNAVAGPGTYAFIDVDAATGQLNALGVDAIKVGMIYKPAKVTPTGATATLTTGAFGLFEVIPASPSDPTMIQRNRPPLAQSFVENGTGAVFTVVTNHLKSKGSFCSNNVNPVPNDINTGDEQGECNQTRTAAANEMMAWLALDPTGVGDADVLITGDLNSYAQEDPITAIRNNGYTDLQAQFGGGSAYSYVFDGEWGYLDYALASPSLTPQISGVTEWHINADEPNVLDYNTNFKSAGQIAGFYSPDAYRSSDHDPVVVGLCMVPALNVTVSPDSLWPPNHKYVTVNATVQAGAGVAVNLVSVTSSEPDNGLGDGDTPHDIVIVDDRTFNLRAERQGGGPGRVYTIVYKATSACGAESTATATVTVPASQGNGKSSSTAQAGVNTAALEDANLVPMMYLPIVVH
ncbi:MAG: ExeM/NucH family extracellular endonuclease [Caldilineaceae bacterium]|nr:ExeM/NucH family extracellular endonuclease [Caldilineaceae bacterium]